MQAKLPFSTTPLITAAGTSNTDPNQRPPELLPALKTGFELEIGDPPEIVALPHEGDAMVSAGIPGAPAPLAQARGQVGTDFGSTVKQSEPRASCSHTD